MAWHYARYIDRVAAAGKAEYPLPMFVNAALNRPNLLPGEYPSAGPLPHLMDVWRAAAPTIDFLAPDLYPPSTDDVPGWCRRYHRPENPLFIPEIANRPATAAEAFYVIGQHDAIGFSPFAIESTTGLPVTGAVEPGDPAVQPPLRAAYGVLNELAPLILEHQGQGVTAGVLLDDIIVSTELRLGHYRLTVSHDYTFPWSSPDRTSKPWPRAGASVIATGDDEYLVAGSGVIVAFTPGEAAGTATQTAGILAVDEGRVQEVRFVAQRRLNGDETHQGRHMRIPFGQFGFQRVRLYRYG
jgi:beta-galactosidase GanA